jgi:MYXO-CTERM domain-containing protein
VRVHPSNPDIVYVGAQGHVFGPNSERGVFKTTDGGKTWRRILYRNDSTGITDLVLDPNNPEIIYAAFWQAWRTPWQLVSGGAGSGIFKSTDGGEHWTELTRNPGLPQGVIGNIGLAVSPSNSSHIWAIIEADSGGVFRSTDGGATWTRTNSDRRLRQRAWYYTRIFADPRDEHSIYVLNTGMYRSTDDGKTFKGIHNLAKLSPLECAATTSTGRECPDDWAAVQSTIGVELDDAGVDAGADAGPTPKPAEEDKGCGCRVGAKAATPFALFGLAAFALLRRRRR